MALTAAEHRWDRRSEDELLNLIEDANAAVVEALDAFTGSATDEFLLQVEAAIMRRLDSQGEAQAV
jgi:hypothetical protein